MSSRAQTTTKQDPRFVSTGVLPPPDEVKKLVEQAHARYRDLEEGVVSGVYPALTRVDPRLFGICVVSANGSVYATGDAEHEFSIMSVSKPFVFALVCQALGAEKVRDEIGVNATGRAFNSFAAVEDSKGKTNPMVNAGAIATTALVPGHSSAERWKHIHQGLSHFAGRRLAMDDEIYASASETNQRNRALARFLESLGCLAIDPEEATDLYTRQCALRVSAKDLAVMGATLAHGGRNPITHERVIDENACRHTLAVMTTAGLYETSGDWIYDVGLPGKSGIGGGIVTVSPGKGGLGTFAPPLDASGNSVKGLHVATFLAKALGLDLFDASSE
jgi:glutaminase